MNATLYVMGIGLITNVRYYLVSDNLFQYKEEELWL